MGRDAGVRSAVIVAGALWLSGGAASAQATCSTQTNADGLEEQGNTLRREQRDREALALFQQSYALCHGARALLRVGLAEAALGQWVEAARDVTEALSRRDDPWITANRAGAEAQLATIGQHLGDLEVLGEGGPAEVWVGNQRIATWPMERPVRVVAGTVVFSVRAPGYVGVTRSAEVAPGRLTREHVELVRAPLAVTAGAPVARVTVAPAPVATTPARPRGSTQRTLAWASGIGAAVFVGTGVVAYVVGSGAAADWNNDSICQQAAMPTVPRGGQCSGLDSTADTMQALSLAGFIGGGALAVASVVLFAVAPGSRPRESAARFGCGVGPTALGMACGGTF